LSPPTALAEVSLLHYRYPGGRPVAVRLGTPEIEPILSGLYSSYACPPPKTGEGATQIELVRDSGEYVLTGPSGSWRCVQAGEAILNFENELAGALLEDAVTHVRLHAAAVIANRCLLLLGPSGAGKSTLSLGLHLRGLTAFADDVVLLAPETGQLLDFRRPLRAHLEGLAELGLRPEDVVGAWFSHPYVWLAREDEPPVGSRPEVIVFLERSADGSELRPISGAESLAGLLRGRMSEDPRRDFACLAALSGSAPGYRLRFCDLPGAVDTLMTLARR